MINDTIRIALVVSLLLLGWSAPVLGQASSSLEGVVTDDGEPLAGATVLLPDVDRGTSTADDGTFTFDDVPVGTHALEVRFVGFETYRTTVTIPHEEPITVRLVEETTAFDDIIVTGSPVGETVYQSAQAFNPEALHERGAASFGEMLDGEPGIAMRSFGPAPARPVIRGFDGDRVLILENGNRMGDLSNTAADHNVALEPMAAERVEVVRGPASLLYGSSAIGGVVNLFTADIPRDWRPGHTGTLSAEGASMNDGVTGYGRYQYGSDAWATTARLSYRNADDVRTPDGLLPGTFIDNIEGAAGLGFTQSNLQGGISVSALDSNFGLPEELDDPDEEAEIRMNQQTVQGELEWTSGGFLEAVELRFHGARLFQQEVETEFNPDGSIDDEDIELEFLQYAGNATLTLQHRPVGLLDAGAIGLNAYVGDTEVGGDEAFTPSVHHETFALFTFQEIPLTNALRLQFGVRGETQSMRTTPNDDFPDSNEQRTSHALSGSVGLNLQPTRGLEVGAQVARSHRFPLLEERFADGIHFGIGAYEEGDPTLDTERSLGTDAFARWQTGRIHAEVSGFYARIDDFVAFEPTGDTFTDDSNREWDVFAYRAADAELWGGEAQLTVAATEALELGGTVDYVRGTRVDTDEPLPTMPPVRGTLSARYDTGTWWVGASTRMVAEQDRVANEELPTDGYTLLNMQAGLCLDANGMHRITARIDNLTNTLYRDHLSRVDRTEFGSPMPGRNIQLGYRYTF